MSTTTASGTVPSATPTSTGTSNSGPQNSPLLFFVALGFGVVFTNLWIIVGVKYCFRYNQRNRQMRALGGNGEPIDLSQVPRPHRRRREKKLMSMEEVNERFPLTKYKTWMSEREAEGLPAAGGVTTTSASRPASVKDGLTTVTSRESSESAQPPTALRLAQEAHLATQPGSSSPTTTAPLSSPEKFPPTTAPLSTPEKPSPTANTTPVPAATNPNSSLDDDDDVEEDDPIALAAAPDHLPAGDCCAICLDILAPSDDIRGLTCSHCFHAACIDPWLTSRRACCPLCKADYYIPKPRPEGEIAAPEQVWTGGRMFVMGPMGFVGSRAGPPGGRAVPLILRRQGLGNDAPRLPRQDGAAVQGRTWRQRMAGIRVPGMVGRRGISEAAAAPAPVRDLEAGR